MRNATILVLRLKGVATETIKNIVLAGIGKLILVDTDDVSAEDLGAGFFFRDEDVGKKVSVVRNSFAKWQRPVRCAGQSIEVSEVSSVSVIAAQCTCSRC